MAAQQLSYGRVLRRARRRAMLALLVPIAVAAVLPAGAAAEHASQPSSTAAARLDVSGGTDLDPSGHSCAIAGTAVRCWGYGGVGRLGYASTATVGDDETPGSVAPVDLGGRDATAISAGGFHSCALLDDGSVRCWGFGAEGRLGLPSPTGLPEDIGDNETPGSAGPVFLGAGRSAVAISAGGAHSCAVLDDGTVRCWGWGSDGRLGYGNRNDVGDDEPPGSVGPVDLGPGVTATAITAGRDHNCALLQGGSVRCWGYGFQGRLGYANSTTIGEDEAPGSVGPVDLGGAAVAISAGNGHSCALLDGGGVRCWGFAGNGRLGYPDPGPVPNDIGDNETPASAGPVQLGGRAVAISAGDAHSCALLDDGSVRCWGFGGDGRLGLGNTGDVGDDETPAAAGPVALGGRAVAISAGGRHTCARLEDGSVRCWGAGFTGRLGLCDQRDIGDDETPGSVAPVNLASSAGCPVAAASPAPPAVQLPVRPPAVVTPLLELLTSKLALARATINRRARVLDVLAPITGRASGSARVELQAAGRRHRFSAPIDSRDARIRFRERIPAAQARLGTGILTIAYPGDNDTRPQTVRLRAAPRSAQLRMTRPTLTADGRLRAAGTVTRRARGVVRMQVEYVADGQTTTLRLRAPIRNGRWSFDERLSQAVRAAIARRTGTVHSYTLFTGYGPARIRGEMRSFQILGAR
jgi:alpha-tubulin suppressor-like RCC1 family protein